MRFSLLLLFLLALLGCSSTISAQEITKKRGKYKLYYPSGKLQSQGKVKNYHRNGEWKYYDEEGRIVNIAHFFLDTIHGAYTEFYPDGKISSQGTYCKNKKCGNWKMFDQNGSLIGDENYVNGDQHGVQRYWYPGGHLRDSILFTNGQVQLRHSWYSSGNLKTIETYVNGLPEGRWTVYPEARVDTFAQMVDDYHLGKRHGWHYQWNGASLIEAYHYKDGWPDGTFTRYEYTGSPLFVQRYAAGKRSGIATYYKNGEVIKEENYQNDLKEGVQTEYNRNNKPSFYSWYRADKMDSSHSLFANGKIAIRKVYTSNELAEYAEWDSAGVLLMKGVLKNGLRHGLWTTYYADGKVRSTTNYEDGRMLGLFTKFYPNGKKMIQYTFLPVGTNTPPDVWNQQGKMLKPGTKQYDEIVEGNRPGEIFSNQNRRSIIEQRVHETDFLIGDAVDGPEPEEEVAPRAVEEANQEEVFTFCEVMPEFPGGIDSMKAYLTRNVHYPTMASDVEGTVYVQYIVELDGRVTNVRVLKGIVGGPGKYMNDEAVRVVTSFPAHTAGKINGRAVRCSLTVPVRFVIH